MSSLFGGAPKIDTSAMDAQAAEAEKIKQEADAKKRKILEEEASKRRATRRKQQGRFSLIAGSELGVQDDVLGGANV